VFLICNNGPFEGTDVKMEG